MSRNHTFHRRTRAFTLLEILLAVVVFGIVLAAINTVFYSALRLRSKTSDLLETSHTVNQALNFLRRDLRNIIPPGGTLAGSLKVGIVSTGTGSTGPDAPGVQMYTTTGLLSDRAPWGDIQKVSYVLREPADRQAVGKTLVRSVTRNLLATGIQDPEEQWMLSNVRSFEVLCYTGNEWRDTWDTTQGDSGSPAAIRVRISLAENEDLSANTLNREPIELLLPLTAQLGTNQTQTTGGQQ